MATYKKGNRHYIDYYLPNGGGRKREVVKVDGIDPERVTRQDALKALAIRKGQVAQGKFDIIKSTRAVLFEKLMNEYLEWAKRNHKSYDRDVTASKPLLSYFRGRAINNISKWHIDGYKATRKSQGVMPATINKELGILKRMYNLALDGTFEGIKINSNPIGKVKLLKTSNPIPRVYKTSEFTTLYNSASEHFKPILLCAYMTGMRRGGNYQVEMGQSRFRRWIYIRN
jgi:integrase